MMTPDTLGRRLREAREAKCLTQLEAGRLLGISNANLSAYELGKREPDFETLVKLADIYGCTVDYLVGRSQYPDQDQPPEALKEEIRLAQLRIRRLEDRKLELLRRRDQCKKDEEREYLDELIMETNHDVSSYRGELDELQHTYDERLRILRQARTNAVSADLMYFLRGKNLTEADAEAVKDLLEARRLRREREEREKNQP